MIILYPCEYKNLNKVDNNFEKEFNACQTIGLDTALFDHDLFVQSGKVKTTYNKYAKDIILRGWMLDKKQYFELFDYFREFYKSELINNPLQYLYCHHFPNVYHDVKQYTPNIIVAHKKDLNDELLQAIHSDLKKAVIIKDFVKSEKGTNLFKIDSNISFPDFKKFVYDFIEARRPLFNEGIVLKEWINLKKDSTGKNTNEWRAFFFNGTLISLDQNSTFYGDNIPSPDIRFVNEIAKNIDRSNFFTIDFAQNKDGEWIVLECGDGQVSGLASNANELEFYQKLKDAITI